ncbi:MAG: ATP synthase F0 subunit C [Deltaproteobacteria bacterium]|jgi:F-type H+-transporting ATPase subunit c|nr:ATP synthase F0 subunit C [Deltaproteobacteria bacterium]
MKKLLVFLLPVMAAGIFPSLSWAAEADVTIAALDTVSTIAWASALGIGIGVLGPALAQGLTLLSACSAISRNPETGPFIRVCMIMGLAIMESLAIYALVVVLLLLYAFPYRDEVLKLITLS